MLIYKDMSDKKYTVFVDNIGRTIVGEELSSNKTTFTLKNPAILHVQPNQQTGQISVQLVPYFFKEFVKDSTNKTEWTFNRSQVTVGNNIDLDDRLVTQYDNLFSVIQAPAKPELAGVGAGGSADPPVVKLFDD
jgi:hypothetical protein